MVLSISSRLVAATRLLARSADALEFRSPVRFVYNPLVYARAQAEAYLGVCASAPKRIVFVGMNPGPWGMAQTGVPFGEVSIVRDWLGIAGKVGSPRLCHPRLPILGFECRRSEVSGRRLWGLLRDRYGTSKRMARELFVANYCPLLFLDEAGRNVTPDKIAREDRTLLHDVCDRFLLTIIETLQPEWLVGVGKFSQSRLQAAGTSLGERSPKIAAIPHPSPASPSANRDWAGQATRSLKRQGVW